MYVCIYDITLYHHSEPSLSSDKARLRWMSVQVVGFARNIMSRKASWSNHPENWRNARENPWKTHRKPWKKKWESHGKPWKHLGKNLNFRWFSILWSSYCPVLVDFPFNSGTGAWNSTIDYSRISFCLDCLMLPCNPACAEVFLYIPWFVLDDGDISPPSPPLCIRLNLRMYFMSMIREFLSATAALIILNKPYFASSIIEICWNFNLLPTLSRKATKSSGKSISAILNRGKQGARKSLILP